MPPALKDWAVTVRALAEGEQFVTVHAGPLHEAKQHFATAGRRFYLYPTFDPRQAGLVRESHVPELKRALEDGVWNPPAPTARMMEAGLAVPEPTTVRLRAWAEVAGGFDLPQPAALDALGPFHIWTGDYAATRFGADPPPRLHVLLLRTHRIPRPVSVRVDCDATAPGRWTTVERELAFEGTPVVSDGEFAAIRSAIAARLAGAGAPA
jgi:hypothetical protein